jgi:hypothetical protein
MKKNVYQVLVNASASSQILLQPSSYCTSESIKLRKIKTMLSDQSKYNSNPFHLSQELFQSKIKEPMSR